jgi:Zn-dependent protease with chaperone function
MSRARQLWSSFLIISIIIGAVVGLWAGRFLPGKAGELFGRIFHILTTPIILEISFGILGIIIVLALSHYHEKNADEWVEMEIPNDTASKDSKEL